MTATAALRRAFEERADGVTDAGPPLVGLFGAGLPRPLVVAAGGRAVDVKAPPLADATDGPQVAAVSAVVEDFMDPFATRFLHRFAAGTFDRFALLLFARDDVAALASYQYATELRRQGRVPRTGPQLYLCNFLHGDSAAMRRYNRTELDRLRQELGAVLGAPPEPDRLAQAVEEEQRRAAAIDTLPPGGEAAFVARNAGRWLDAATHCDLLAGVPAGCAGAADRQGARIALVGTACDIPVLHGLCAEFGQVVADLQEYGRAEPVPTDATPEALLQALAADPLHIRAAPPVRYTAALQEAVRDCDLVIASVDRNDDSFGWEIPGLGDAVTRRGARFVDLGFRPLRPGADWIRTARARIAEALA